MDKTILKKAYFSTSEVAKILHVSRITVFNRIRTGLIPAQKFGRNYAISEEALGAILGHSVSSVERAEIREVVDKAVKDYHAAFQKLGKE
jgi:excisionase family DNA binding protein